MNKVKVLIEGYAKEIDDGWIASSTVTLVQSDGKNIIVDPGCNRKKLIEALKKNDLKPADIDFVFLTHNHADHTLLAGVFKKAKVLTCQEIYDGDKQTEHRNKIPGTNVQIVQTPGHCPEHCSLIVPTATETYVVAGDVFWWQAGRKQDTNIEKEDEAHPEEVNMEKLIKSRRYLLQAGDYIIPGHGKTFRVP